jgi:hypothetical protein
VGSKYRQPKPGSPELLKLERIDSVKFLEYPDGSVSNEVVVVQATFEYFTFNSDSVELVEAVKTLEKVITKASQRAETKRNKGSEKENESLMEELSAIRSI